MKRYHILIMIITLLLITACSNTLKYDEGKDSILSFGDGTYQIIHQQDNSENLKLLTNCKHNQCVLTQIDYHTTEKNFAYFVGNYYSKNELLYFVEENDEEFAMVYLNDMLSDGQIKLFSSFDDYSETDKIKVAKMKSTAKTVQMASPGRFELPAFRLGANRTIFFMVLSRVRKIRVIRITAGFVSDFNVIPCCRILCDFTQF